MNRKRLAAAVAALATAGSVAGVALAATPKVTAKGVGDLKVGMTLADARAAGLVGKARDGCEFDPGSKVARIAGPLKGLVDLTKTTPRTITAIHLTGGPATARGVGIGDTLADAKAAYPKGKTDKGLADVFQLWFYRVPKNGGGKLVFQVEPTGAKEVVGIDVPRSAFCD